MIVPTIIFRLLALLTIGSAVLVVTARNILHAAFALCLSFLGVAGLYLFLQADFLAAVQLVVYVGGILVLILFAVMFSSQGREDTDERQRSRLGLAVAGVASLAILLVIVLLTSRLQIPLAEANPSAAAPYQAVIQPAAGQTGLGHALMGRYLLPFEVVSVLLLAALVGAVVIVRKELS